MARFAKLLILTHESVAEKMAGPGIRAWEMGRALAVHGVPVTLASPYPSDRRAAGVDVRAFCWDERDTIVRLVDDSEVVLAAGPVLARLVHLFGQPLQKPTIVDLYDVAEIERILLSLKSQKTSIDPVPALTQELFAYLRQGDLFICAHERQWDFWAGALMAAGRINQQTLAESPGLGGMLHMVPFGIPEQPPQKANPQLKGVMAGIGPNDRVVLWGGGIWDWTDPLLLIDALEIVLTERQDIRLAFFALHHFNPAVVPEMAVARQLLERIQSKGWLNKYVFFMDWIPYDQRGAILLEADLGISLNVPSIENRYAIRARLLDYLWAGLPCVLTSGDLTAQRLHDAGLAALVEPGDVQGVARAVLERLSQAKRLAPINDLSIAPWSECVAPLLNFLENPRFAPDAKTSRSSIDSIVAWQSQLDSLQEQNAQLQAEVSLLRRRKVVRLADSIGNVLHKARKR